MTYSLSLYRADKQIFDRPERWVNPPAVSPDVFPHHEKKMVYIGGLYNLMGEFQQARFVDLIQTAQRQRPEKPISFYSVAVCRTEASDDFNEAQARSLIQLDKTGRIGTTPYANGLIKDLFLPDRVLASWKGAKKPQQAMSDYFSNICLVGFSYGHRIIQQMDEGLQQRLGGAGLPVEPLSHLRSVSFAPATMPIPNGQIQQLCLVRKADRYVFRAYEKSLFDDPQERMPVRQIGSALCVGEVCTDNRLRSISFDSGSGVAADVSFFSQKIPKGHNYWQYVNPPLLFQSGDAAYFNNSCIGALFRCAVVDMLTQKGEGFSFRSGSAFADLADPKHNAATAEALRRWRIKTVRHFGKIRANSDYVGPAHIKRRLDRAQKAPAPIPLP